MDNGKLPNNSPAASGVRWNISAAPASKATPSAVKVQAQWEQSAATSRRASALISHSRGMTDHVLLEIFSTPPSGGDRGSTGGNGLRGSTLLVGLGLVKRSHPEPVADLFLQNLVHYMTTKAATPPAPAFENGHVISWGNYSSEKGVAFSNPSGLSIWACRVNASCAMNGQGNRPCGRVLLGPFSWSHMGQQEDLNPKNSTAWGAVWLRTGSTTITTVFSPSPSDEDRRSPPPPVPTVSVEVLATDFSVRHVLSCHSQSETNSAECDLSAARVKLGEQAGAELHIGLRFLGRKQDPHSHGVTHGLLTTSFA